MTIRLIPAYIHPTSQPPFRTRGIEIECTDQVYGDLRFQSWTITGTYTFYSHVRAGARAFSLCFRRAAQPPCSSSPRSPYTLPLSAAPTSIWMGVMIGIKIVSIFSFDITTFDLFSKDIN